MGLCRTLTTKCILSDSLIFASLWSATDGYSYVCYIGLFAGPRYP